MRAPLEKIEIVFYDDGSISVTGPADPFKLLGMLEVARLNYFKNLGVEEQSPIVRPS